MSENLVSMRVLTFNLWGIFNSKMKTERMMHFASKIEHYDVILLQEQFDSKDLELIKQQLSPEVRASYHFCRFQTGFYGCGCAIISRYPILSAFSYVYPLQGIPEMLLHGDFFANKGVARVVVNVPLPDSNDNDSDALYQPVIVYITHLVATYQKARELQNHMNERYLPFRISQAISLANYIINTSSPRNYIIIGGDFNSSQDSLEVRMMLILLRNKGYKMQSVLPLPIEPDEKHIKGSRKKAPVLEPIHSLYTYSYRNSFNSSSTSYFKLLNQEADIPSQIDHIFYSSNTFQIASFEDCPDVAKGFPFYHVVDGGKVPNGVVVFTESEVRQTSKPFFLGRWARAWYNQLRGRQSLPNGENAMCKAGDQAELFPISDHFGVGARLNLLTRCDGYDSKPGSRVMSPLMRVSNFTEEDLQVVSEVVSLLQSHVSKFRDQIKLFRIISAVSLTIVIISAYSMMQVTAAQENRTAELLRRLYSVKFSNGDTGAGGGVPHRSTWNEEVSNFFGGSIQAASSLIPTCLSSCIFKILEIVGVRKIFGFADSVVHPSATRIDGRWLSNESDPDFAFIAKSLANRPFWLNSVLSSLIHVTASLFGLSAFLIGNIQRLGNAKVLEDEINLIVPLLSRNVNGFRSNN